MWSTQSVPSHAQEGVARQASALCRRSQASLAYCIQTPSSRKQSNVLQGVPVHVSARTP